MFMKNDMSTYVNTTGQNICKLYNGEGNQGKYIEWILDLVYYQKLLRNLGNRCNHRF